MRRADLSYGDTEARAYRDAVAARVQQREIADLLGGSGGAGVSHRGRPGGSYTDDAIDLAGTLAFMRRVEGATARRAEPEFDNSDDFCDHLEDVHGIY